jgi:hypothetical protein
MIIFCFNPATTVFLDFFNEVCQRQIFRHGGQNMNMIFRSVDFDRKRCVLFNDTAYIGI